MSGGGERPPFGRAEQLAFFGGFDLPVLNVTAEVETGDFAGPAKARGVPPFAVLLHALAQASLDVEPFRWRLLDGRPLPVEELLVSYTVIGADGHLNFSTFPHDEDFGVFLERYLADREEARAASNLRLTGMEHRNYLFVTGLPWMRFTHIQHPIGRLADCSIPALAAGRFTFQQGRLTVPLAVQAHHGLVDGLHIHQYMARVSDLLDVVAWELDEG
jgi:chloramphenicol O-acetyltransferase type A